MKSTLFILLLCLVAASGSLGEPKHSDDYSKRILGRWLGPRKFVVFHANGNYGVQRNEEASEDIQGRWRIQGRTLFLTYPSDNGVGTPVHMITSAYTIISFSPKSFTTEADGHKEVYERSP